MLSLGILEWLRGLWRFLRGGRETKLSGEEGKRGSLIELLSQIKSTGNTSWTQMGPRPGMVWTCGTGGEEVK